MHRKRPGISVAITGAALGVVITLLKGRSIGDGALALVAILSPSVMMGVERGNLDLLILALVGAAALFYEEQRIGRMAWSVGLISLAIVLKLFPIFCVAVGSRFNWRSFLFASAIAIFSLGYLVAISHYIFLIRINVPTTFILSYGYKALFLGLDQLRADAGLNPLGLADTWVPITMAILTLLLAAATALVTFQHGRMFCTLTNSVAGTAFLFGSGIYCGTFLLGTNFIYRLMFLLLCRAAASGLAEEGIRVQRAENRTRSFRYRVIRPVVERRSKWTYDFLVGAASDQLAAVLWASDRHYVELSEESLLAHRRRRDQVARLPLSAALVDPVIAARFIIRDRDGNHNSSAWQLGNWVDSFGNVATAKTIAVTVNGAPVITVPGASP